jgi:hypothetical protein
MMAYYTQEGDNLIPFTAEETAAKDAEIAAWKAGEAARLVREQRDQLLAASDTMALADRITDEWRTYRQNLRDLPAAEGFPDVAFPTPPS